MNLKLKEPKFSEENVIVKTDLTWVSNPGHHQNMFEVLENLFSLTWSFWESIKHIHPFDKCVSIQKGHGRSSY